MEISDSGNTDTLTPRTVLITGASGGIGRATVLLFARYGWRVIGVDRSTSPEAFPQDGFFIQSDISIGANLEAIFSKVHAHTGYLNALVNNAGVQGPFSAGSAGVLLLDPGSIPRILSLTDGNLLAWSSVSNKLYQVMATTNLAAGFVPISGVITATGPTTLYLDLGPTNSQKFYRVEMNP